MLRIKLAINNNKFSLVRISQKKTGKTDKKMMNKKSCRVDGPTQEQLVFESKLLLAPLASIIKQSIEDDKFLGV